MPNEFVTRNGLISLNNSQITGSLSVTQGVTASLFGTSSWSSQSLTASYIGQAVSASYAATASSADNFFVRQNVTASNALLTGTLTAQTLVVQTVSSSVVYSSGSNTFGNLPSNIQQFTGSLRVTGSGDHFIIGGNVGIDTITPSAKLEVNGDVNITGSLNSVPMNSYTQAASGFAKSFAIVNNKNIGVGDTGSFPVWRCQVPCTASAINVYFDAGTNVVVNGKKNASALLASNLTNSTANTWATTTTLQNQTFAVGDTLFLDLVSFSGTPKEITIQANFIY